MQINTEKYCKYIKKINTYHHELASTTTCMRSVRSVRAKTQCLESSTLPRGQQAVRHTQPSPRFILLLIWGRTWRKDAYQSVCLEVCLTYIFFLLWIIPKNTWADIWNVKMYEGNAGNPFTFKYHCNEWVRGWVLRPSVLPHLAAGLTLNHIRLTHSRAEDTMTMKPHTHSQFTQTGREKQSD